MPEVLRDRSGGRGVSAGEAVGSGTPEEVEKVPSLATQQKSEMPLI